MFINNFRDAASDDDIIGTINIPISAISASGDDGRQCSSTSNVLYQINYLTFSISVLITGYLPCFGPSFIPIYGSSREWELLESDTCNYMNRGIEEGCAYRGRVMFSLTTDVGDYPSIPITDMDDLVFSKIQVIVKLWILLSVGSEILT